MLNCSKDSTWECTAGISSLDEDLQIGFDIEVIAKKYDIILFLHGLVLWHGIRCLFRLIKIHNS
jgi:hypothetical protein